MAISENEIAQVRNATDIVALISETVALKKSGQRWWGLCPFHGESTPSFSVNAEMGLFYCFGCHKKGDQITWLREIHHMDFMDAVRQLADKAGIELHEDENAGPQRKERQEFMAAMQSAVDWYHERLLHAPDARPAREYLKSRGINGEIARQFKLGWAPDEWDALASSLKLSAKVLEGTGLGFVNKRDRKQDALRARIIFPIFDPAGKAIAVGGRILPSNAGPRADGRTEAKYKNSPETPIYSKRRTLYALNWAKDDVIKSGEIIVCEGYTDVIAFFTAGLPRAVATCGTALGEEHFRAMKNFAKRIVLAYDGDSAGQTAAASVYQWEKQHDVDVAVARFPKGVDPAELAQKDPEALRQAVANAVPFMQFRLERVLDAANIATAEGRARAAEIAMQVIAEHPSDLVRDQYVMNVADRLRLDASTIRQRVSEGARSQARSGTANQPAADGPTVRVNPLMDAMPRPGLEALRLAIHFPNEVQERLVPAYFVHETQREVFTGLKSGKAMSSSLDDLASKGYDDAVNVLNQLVVEELERTYTADDITAVISQLLRSAVNEELKNVERGLREGSVAPDVAMATIRDVKERVNLLSGPHHELAETDLRAWLVSRSEESMA